MAGGGGAAREARSVVIAPGIQHDPILCDPLTGGSHMLPLASAASFEGYIIFAELHVVSGSIVMLIFWLLAQWEPT